MNESIGIRRLRRTLLIHRVIQLLLCGLLIYMALHFQQLLLEQGMPQVFRNSLLATLLFQLLLFFPLHRFAGKEARRELATASVQSSPEQLKLLRQQRLFGDILKGAVFLGFAVFIMIAPPVTFVLCTALFTFIATIITYLQCFNFAVRRGIGSTPPAPA